MSIPILRSLGCGQADSMLGLDRRLYCCENFKLNCGNGNSDSAGRVTVMGLVARLGMGAGLDSSVGVESGTILEGLEHEGGKLGTNFKKEVEEKPLLTKVRTLGQGCQSEYVRCAIGLECRLGICMRDKSRKHFQRLMAVGKDVEAAENLVAEEEEVSGVRVKGYSVYAGEAEVVRDDRAVVDSEEEDEVAANVADYLSARGIKISDSDWHAIRDLIAGTLDEREEREEQVDEADSAEEELSKALKESQQRNSSVSLKFDSSSGASSSSKPSKPSSPTQTAEPELKLSHSQEDDDHDEEDEDDDDDDEDEEEDDGDDDDEDDEVEEDDDEEEEEEQTMSKKPKHTTTKNPECLSGTNPSF